MRLTPSGQPQFKSKLCLFSCISRSTLTLSTENMSVLTRLQIGAHLRPSASNPCQKVKPRRLSCVSHFCCIVLNWDDTAVPQVNSSWFKGMILLYSFSDSWFWLQLCLKKKNNCSLTFSLDTRRDFVSGSNGLCHFNAQFQLELGPPAKQIHCLFTAGSLLMNYVRQKKQSAWIRAQCVPHWHVKTNTGVKGIKSLRLCIVNDKDTVFIKCFV